jgi:hypothetical protein
MTRTSNASRRHPLRVLAVILAVFAAIISPQAALAVILAVVVAFTGVLSVLIIRSLAGNPACAAPTAALSGG